MLDSNLPTFFLKASPDSVKYHEAFYFTQHGSEPEPAYTFRKPDPAAPSARNCYAAGLFDAYNPDVLFGEVLIHPEWSQPSLSLEEIRRNGGVPPPPQPIMPTEIPIQLYDPDQQVIVRQKSGSWGGAASYEFSMPQNTFRLPSASALDRTLNDPAADATTPKINFVWRREGKMSKDLTCFMTGKSTDPGSKKKKNKEPDIAIALFSSLRELTVYQSNLYRVDMEDPKGLEITLLLGAAAIRDIFFGQMNETFNIGDPTTRKNSSSILSRKHSSPVDPTLSLSSLALRPAIQNPAPHGTAVTNASPQPRHASANDARRQTLPPLNTSPGPRAASQPPIDPLAQWALEAETARLKAQQEELKRLEDAKRRERQKQEDAETKRLRKMVEAEDKERRRKQAEVDKETERLRRKYGTQENVRPAPTPTPAMNRYSAPLLQAGPTQRPPVVQQHTAPQRLSNGLFATSSRPGPGSGPYLHAPAAGTQASASSSAFFGGNGLLRPDEGRRLKAGKKSFWGLRSGSGCEGGGGKLNKKQSSMF
ncbi:hypothetical protein K490DRAFT_70521 [Saccharata proteae CBS 121410]|uniref:Uncharacterized protein n=1 Tax=Saccharata proteae CBS 121410 TaxID=1314787 RepID=A0A9P4HYS7_9PEZI|nr:hypothetical protein K490DRAFT_70521 [Saccharata proteae CBS 121410]